MERRIARAVLSVAFPTLAVGTDFVGAAMLVTAIENDFNIDITTTQWVFNIYALTFAMTLVANGRLADMLGRRRMLLAGLCLFMLSSAACALSPTIALLLVSRAIQGVSAAMMWPCVVAIPQASVPAEKRGTTMGLVMGCVTMGNIIGPMVAGSLASFGDWRWFFGFNVILAVLGVLMALWLVEPSPDRRREKIDYAGMIALTLAAFALMYAMDVGGDWGWVSWQTIGLLVVAAILAAVFPLIERAVPQPMMPAKMLRNGHFIIALLANGLMVPAFFMLFLYCAQYLNKVEGWSELASTFGTLPMMFTIAATAVLGGRIFDRFGAKWPLVIGFAGTIVGCLSVWAVSRETGYGMLVVMMVVTAGCGGMCVPLSSTAAVGAVSEKNAGLAGGLSFMSHLGIGAIGVAIGTAILSATSAAHLQASLSKLGIDISSADQATLNGGSPQSESSKAILSKFSPDQAGQITDAMEQAFTHGFHLAYLAPLAFAVVGLVLVLCLTSKKLESADA
ncbi:MAG: MFS transporter [Planctomycetota bacterium]